MPEARDQIWVDANIDPTLLVKATEDYAHFVQGVAEGVWNEVDYGATRVFVQLVRHGKEADLYIWGDGEGVDDEGLRAIVSLMNSPSAAYASKRGKKGTGSKAFCRHARALTVQTIRRGESMMLSVSYTTQELNVYLHGRERVAWQRQEIPAGCKLSGHGTCFIWHGLGKGEADYVNEKHPRTIQILVDEIAQRLPRDVIRLITIIDERGKQQKPVERELVGEVIEGTTTLPVLGAAAFHIAVTTSVNPLDRLKLWALDPACSINTFLYKVRRTAANASLIDGISRELDDPRVIGEISIPALKEYILRQSDAGFRQELYDDDALIFPILAWLYSEVVPRVAVLKKTEPSTQTDCDAMRNELVSAFQKIGSAPKDQPPTVDVPAPDPLLTSPSRITLEMEDVTWIELERPVEGKAYRWDDSKSGGVVNPRRGARTLFTAGNRIGSFVLSLLEGETSREIGVEIAERLLPTVPNRARHGIPGQKLHHHLIHTKHLVGKPTWRLGEGGGTIKVDEDGLGVDHFLPDVPDAYDLWVEGTLDAGETFRLKIVVYVEAKMHEPRPPRDTHRTEFEFGGHTYVLAIRNFPGSEVPSSYTDVITGGRTRLTLNFGFPVFLGGEAIRLRVARLLITQLIAADEFRRKPLLVLAQEIPNLISLRANTIFAELASRAS